MTGIFAGAWCRKVLEWLGASPDRRVEIFLACCAVVFTFIQLKITVSNNQYTSFQTDQLIQAAKYNAMASAQNAAAAESFAASAHQIDDGIGRAVVKLQEQADATGAASERSEDDARNALQTTIDNFHLEQRPWIGITLPFSAPVPSAPTGDPNAVKLSQQLAFLLNTGRTPALDVRGIVAHYVPDNDADFPGVPSDGFAEWMGRIVDAQSRVR